MWAVTAAQVQAVQATAVGELRRTTGALVGVQVWHFPDWTVTTKQKQNCMTNHKTRRQVVSKRATHLLRRATNRGKSLQVHQA